jgi:hypothetical protein
MMQIQSQNNKVGAAEILLELQQLASSQRVT